MPPKKARTVFVCQQCGYQAPRWAGQCPDCGEWNTLVEQVSVKETRRTATALDTAELVNGVLTTRDARDAYQATARVRLSF